MHKTELQAFLEDHSPDVVTLNETFTKKGYKYNMPHYTAVTRNREHGKGGGVAILLRQDLAYTEIDGIQLTSTTDNEQLTVAIRLDIIIIIIIIRLTCQFHLKWVTRLLCLF